MTPGTAGGRAKPSKRQLSVSSDRTCRLAQRPLHDLDGDNPIAAASVSAEQNPSAGVIEHHRAEPAHLVGAQEAADAAQAAQVHGGD
jgi:hypothetical protein